MTRARRLLEGYSGTLRGQMPEQRAVIVELAIVSEDIGRFYWR